MFSNRKSLILIVKETRCPDFPGAIPIPAVPAFYPDIIPFHSEMFSFGQHIVWSFYFRVSFWDLWSSFWIMRWRCIWVIGRSSQWLVLPVRGLKILEQSFISMSSQYMTIRSITFILSWEVAVWIYQVCDDTIFNQCITTLQISTALMSSTWKREIW